MNGGAHRAARAYVPQFAFADYERAVHQNVADAGRIAVGFS